MVKEVKQGKDVVIITNNISRKIRVKALVISLVMCLGLYPTAELTRVIWAISFPYDPDRLAIWVFETVSIWILYLSIIPVMILSIRWFESQRRNHYFTDARYEKQEETQKSALETSLNSYD